MNASTERKQYWHAQHRFRNPKDCFQTVGFHFMTVWWLLTRLWKPPYRLGTDLPFDHVLNVDEAKRLKEKYINDDTITWLGHASFLFKCAGISLLTDPLLFGTPGTSLFRGLRRLPNPLQADALEEAQYLLLSHEHADHIHMPSLKSLKNRSSIQPIVPLGVGKKIKSLGFKTPIELDWFQSHTVDTNVTITAVPAVHYSDFSNNTLWSGFVIAFKDARGKEKKIYFGGDSGYGPFFKEDIAPYGPFDAACIGVGSFYLPYPSRAPSVHTNPEQAIVIAEQINARKIIGMHWGTVRMADEDPKTLLPRMCAHTKTIGYAGEVAMLAIGETIPIQ